jgi:DNA-binding Lrp family transcriptional regulator
MTELKQILEILQNDARTSPEQIATMTGLPVTKVVEAISQAEKDRVIIRYKTIVNWLKLGEEQVFALVEVKVTPQRNTGFDSIAKRIYEFPQTRNVYLVSGTYDIAVLVSGKTMQDVAVFVAEKLAPLDTVMSTVTHFLLKRYKEDGDILDGGEEMKRLAVSP